MSLSRIIVLIFPVLVLSLTPLAARATTHQEGTAPVLLAKKDKGWPPDEARGSGPRHPEHPGSPRSPHSPRRPTDPRSPESGNCCRDHEGCRDEVAHLRAEVERLRAELARCRRRH